MMNVMISPPQPPPDNEMDDRHHDDAKVTAPMLKSTYAAQLAKLYDVSMVDSYLLQTYIVPHVIDALHQLLLPLLSFYRTQQKSRHQQHHGDATTDASVKDADIIPDFLLPRLVRCVVPVFTLLWTGGMTPAMRQMNLQFHCTNRRETKTGNFRSKLLVYATLLYIVPELLYPLLRYYIQSKMNHVATTTLSGSTVSGEQNRSTHPPPNVPNDPTLIKKRRQYLMLQWLQSILQHVDTKVIPIVQFVMLLRCWSGTSTTSLPMILAGLTYVNTTTTAMMMVPTESPTAVFYLDLAHRRWFTHHIWETIGTILLPSVRANMVSSPHALVSHIQRVVHRFRTLVQGTVAAMVRPPSTSSSSTLSEITTSRQKDISVRSQQQNDNDNTTTCPLCQQIPPTMSVRVSCPTCRKNHQMYCYACFYQYYGMNDRQHHPGDDLDEDQIDDDYDHHLACVEGGSSSRSSSRRRHTTSVGTQPQLVPVTRASYRIPIRERSTYLQCRVCHTAVDTVSFGHPTQ